MGSAESAKVLRRWLPYHKASPHGRVRLFCLPFAGGAASAYRAWDQGLPAWIEICAVQLAGRETRFTEQPAVDLLPLVEQLDTALAPFLEDGTPFALYGHSVGGTIALELARLWARRGATRPLHLFVGASIRTRPADEPLVSELGRAELVEALRRWNGTRPELLENPEMLDIILPAFRADNALFERHHHVPPAHIDRLDIPLTAFGGASDPSVTEDHLQAWADTCVSFRSRVVPGDHFFAFPTHTQLFEEITVLLAQGLRAQGRRDTELTNEPTR
jgi:medium-chain acyl-[acyl-carrier-protein] hydrolase